MAPLNKIREQNAIFFKHAPKDMVAVFVGGTSGIGLYTAREFVRGAQSPRLILVGRNQSEATKIIQELKSINASSQVSFIQKDVSLLKNVDEVCKEIAAKEQYINLLFMTCGYYTLKGREETSEGLDKKFALHYYSRMRFINQLQPLLAKAINEHQYSRVLAVLDPQPGMKGGLNFSDMSLKSGFSLMKCATHASAMTNLAFAHLAKKNVYTSYIHAFPYVVDTGVGRDAWGPLKSVVAPILKIALKGVTVDQKESGERHLFAATDGSFLSKNPTESVAPDYRAIGSDGEKGSGSYLLNWNSETLPDTKAAKQLREEGGEAKVWEHTEEVFKKICEEGGKY